MKKLITLLVLTVAFATSTFASPHKINTRLASGSNFKKFLVEQYHYTFMTSCGQSVIMTTNYKMSDNSLLVFSTAFDAAFCNYAD